MLFRKVTANPELSVTGPEKHIIYFPLIAVSDRFNTVPAIWAPGAVGEKNQVVLFRYTFSLENPLNQSALHIFADTRFEAWLDGVWLGRGPARFARTLHEYDVLPAGELVAGEHVLAVLVQWAPNIRRSDSLAPLLKARLLDRLTGGRVIALSSAQWKTLFADAWQPAAALVHSWDLIGPTELLDFRKLPADWQTLGFDDHAWGGAQLVDETALLSSTAGGQGIVYQPRSIPILQAVPVSIQVLDRGRLSPDHQILELAPSQQPELTFRLSQATTLDVQALAGSYAPAPGGITVDSQPLAWSLAGATRPDVSLAQVALPAGLHTLRLPYTGPMGLTLGISRANLSELKLTGSSAPLFDQGLHAGRRLLLSQPQADAGAVLVEGSQPLTLTFPTQPAYVVLDLGRTVHGRLAAAISGPAGTVIDVGWDERLLPGTSRPLPFPGSQHVEWNQVDSWILDGDQRELTTMDTRAGRYVLIAVWGPAAGSGSQPVILSNLLVMEERYPVEQSGSFVSDDPRLNTIWQKGVDSLYPNMTDGYTDTPWRERGQWWGDAYIEDLINRQAFGDNLLLRRGLVMMAVAFQDASAPGAAPNNHAPNMLDYSMLWVLDLADYSQRSGDRQLLFELYPTLSRFMQHLASYQNLQTGLLDVPYDYWWLTGYIDTRGYINRFGQSTALNSLYVATLQQASWIAEQVGDGQASQQWAQAAPQVRDAIHRVLFVPAENRYLAHIYQGQPDTYAVSPHAQAWALAYGIVPAANRQAVADSLIAALSNNPANPNVDTYGMYWVLKGLGEAGRVADALAVIELYYGGLLDLGATSWWERFDSGCCFNSSLSHAWGGSPTWFLTTYLLGVQPTGPREWTVDLSRVLLAARQTGLQHVAGRLPVAPGEVDVSWQLMDCQSGVQVLQVSLVSPPELHGVLKLPAEPDVSLRLNDTLFTTPVDGTGFLLGPGVNILELGFVCKAGD